MELYKYDSLKNLNTSTYDWNCLLRLQAFWKAMNRETKEIWGINMLFIDDSNCRIHAYASAKYCEPFEKQLKEGQVYFISNFQVKYFRGDETYRPVRNGKHISFTEKTKINPSVSSLLKIDMHAFDLTDFDELEKSVADNRFLIDVVGVLQNFQPHYTGTKTTTEKPKVKFDLFDGRSTVKITLFEQLGLHFEDAIQAHTDSRNYVIISAAKVGKYEGQINLTNYPATRVYINPKHYSIAILKRKIDATEVRRLPILPEEDPIPMRSVKEIKLLRGPQPESKVSCRVVVKKVDERVPWYYANCTGCALELQKQGPSYKCVNCDRIIPYPDKRFRLCTIFADVTGSIAIILPNSEVTRIIDRTVFDIETDAIMADEEDKFPPILRQFLNKNFTITLQLTNDNLLNGSNVYEACMVSESLDLTGNFDPAKQSSVEMIEVSPATENEDKDSGNNTPHTAGSCTKARARNIDAMSITPIESGPPKQFKTPKTEKE